MAAVTAVAVLEVLEVFKVESLELYIIQDSIRELLMILILTQLNSQNL